MAVGDIIHKVLLVASEWKHCDDDNNDLAVPKCPVLGWGLCSPSNNSEETCYCIYFTEERWNDSAQISKVVEVGWSPVSLLSSLVLHLPVHVLGQVGEKSGSQTETDVSKESLT